MIEIIWNNENAEDEYKKVVGGRTKTKINREARKNIEKFINSERWKKILKLLKDKEKEIRELERSE